jgi:hypothetical protein
MATIQMETTYEPKAPAIVRPVGMPEMQCGECMYHIPHATRPGGWCASKQPELSWQPVDPKRTACAAATAWPEGSPAPAFIAAMRL